MELDLKIQNLEKELEELDKALDNEGIPIDVSVDEYIKGLESSLKEQQDLYNEMLLKIESDLKAASDVLESDNRAKDGAK